MKENKTSNWKIWRAVILRCFVIFSLFVYSIHFVSILSAKTISQKDIEPPLNDDFSSVPYGLYGSGPNPYEEEEGLFEGDIAGVDQNSFQDKNVILDPSKKWLNTTIPYMIDQAKFNESDLDVIYSAFEEFATLTCIRFVPVTIYHSDFLVILALNGCWSFVGRYGGAQPISLQNPGCVHKGIVVHELMHALGIWHEQSRFDRDDYVIINWSNIEEEYKYNFQKRELNDSQTFGLDYDYGSVMHYSAYSFALNRSIPTIIPIKRDATLGQRKGLSQVDAQKINILYHCPILINNTHKNEIL